METPPEPPTTLRANDHAGRHAPKVSISESRPGPGADRQWGRLLTGSVRLDAEISPETREAQRDYSC
jgi:hypothetical protein